jgi:uncharacterized protein
MRALGRLFSLLMLIALGGAASGTVAIPPSPAQWATDTAGFLQPQTVAELDARLRAYQSATGHQVLVYVAPTTGATPTEDWTVRAFQRWKVGRKGLDDGLILFVFPSDRKVRIEVGYGLEQSVPDAIAARIIRDRITPKIRAGQPDAAVTSGVDAVLGAIGGEPRAGGGNASGSTGVAAGPGGKAQGAGDARLVTPAPAESDGRQDVGYVIGVWAGILIALLIVAGIFFLVSKLPDTGPYISSGGSGGGWGGLLLGGLVGGVMGGGFSGFSGGGGMSGGGGATGSW